MHSIRTLSLLTVLTSVSPILAADVWTVNCGVLSVQRSDPIISPGVPSGHVHAIAGGTAFARSMTGLDAAADAVATTCDKYTDHSNYWCPQLYNMKNGMLELVPFTGANMYYKRYTCSFQEGLQWCPTIRDAKPFPPGLRMVAGDPSRRTQDNSDQTNQAILYETGNSGEMYGFPKTLASNLQLNVRFPSCWDGVNIDSPDHKSHMSYPDPTKGDTEGGMCPESHPVAVLSIGAEFSFDTGSLGISDSSSLVLSMGDTTGYGGHGDFIQGWQNLTALGESFDMCNGIGQACAWNSFGTPNGQMGVKSTLTPQTPAVFEEEIGLNGPISTLPGKISGAITSAAAATSISALASPSSVPLASSTFVPTTMMTLSTSAPPQSTYTSTALHGQLDGGDTTEDNTNNACEL